MNQRIAKLYDRALVLDSNGDYVAGELNPEKFAELIILECAETIQDFVDHRFPASEYPVRLKRYYGIEE